MEYKQFGNTYMIRTDRGEDIVESLKKVCEDEHIRLGRAEAIGATDHAVIGVYDLAKKEYYPEEINEFMEIASLNGNITEMGGKPYIHLHATLADQHHATKCHAASGWLSVIPPIQMSSSGKALRTGQLLSVALNYKSLL